MKLHRQCTKICGPADLNTFKKLQKKKSENSPKILRNRPSKVPFSTMSSVCWLRASAWVTANTKMATGGQGGIKSLATPGTKAIHHRTMCLRPFPHILSVENSNLKSVCLQNENLTRHPGSNSRFSCFAAEQRPMASSTHCCDLFSHHHRTRSALRCSVVSMNPKDHLRTTVLFTGCSPVVHFLVRCCNAWRREKNEDCVD